MDRIQLTPVSGLSVPVELSKYYRTGNLLCEEETGQHFVSMPLPDGNTAFYAVDTNDDELEDSTPIFSKDVEIVDMDDDDDIE